MAPLGNFPHMKNVDIGLEIDPTHLKNLPHLKKKVDIAIGGLKALWLPGLTQHRFSSKLPPDLPC